MNVAPVAVVGASGQIGALVLERLAAAGRTAAAVGRTAPTVLPAGAAARTIARYGRDELRAALDGCGAVIATLGLPYVARTWEQEWPPLVAAVAAACDDLGLPLTFLDNVYVYGAATGVLTESTALAPCSRKGAARLAGWRVLEERAAAGLDVVVCRAADFVGPGATTSVLPWEAVTTAARTGGRRSLRWLGSPDARHTFALTTEVAAALVRVADDPALRGGPVLHLPVTEPVTGRTVAAALGRVRDDGRRVRLRALRAPVVRVAALVDPSAREQVEMMYQVEHDQVVDDGRIRTLGWSGPRVTVDDVAALAAGRSSAGLSPG
ncbi:NAD-dependent epimerase/dehydratase family protein [Cellulomonas sp. Sa3CUA2]|uniref:NAD-dependent epimerase/dehydratase family protein n=1 Tax=Cellulomonas avistercoris TaxID=2762242 RepID=A0ABR8QG80_9CELL|nr:NAD-dependent epimerase/dehydratase family protein [Cellulomonas avistercoris]MBD7919432.1 NAD-dependent epimerase/dehydratase family protein [Cellulomonas avistercoris]